MGSQQPFSSDVLPLLMAGSGRRICIYICICSHTHTHVCGMCIPFRVRKYEWMDVCQSCTYENQLLSRKLWSQVCELVGILLLGLALTLCTKQGVAKVARHQRWSVQKSHFKFLTFLTCVGPLCGPLCGRCWLCLKKHSGP